MFETRLRVLLAILGFALAIVLARLVDMQIIHAETYEQQAEDALLLPAQTVPAVRGRILDRLGVELATEEPCWDIKLDYGLLAMQPTYLMSRVDWCRRHETYGENLDHDEIERLLLADIDQCWQDLSAFSGKSVQDLKARAAEICDRIETIRAAVAAHRGFDAPVLEERMRHAIVTGLDDQQQVAARRYFARYPWVQIEDSTRRVYHCGPSMAHVVGRLGPVTAKTLENDPFADDPLRAYQGDERLGVSGVERAAEELLRGRRGRFQRQRDDVVVEDTDPQPGADVHLTIRADLQAALYALLDGELAKLPNSTGASIVVLGVDKGEVLALVSYPGYDPERFDEDYATLRADTRRQPLRFRAVANQYAPGSIVKPLVCLAGLDSGEITLDTTFTCRGSLFPNHPDSWRCWSPSGTSARMHHGALNAEAAIKNSCNIFMYHVGELVGADQLCTYFDMVGFGRRTGTGLVEEALGINPTPSWLAGMDRPVTAGTARLFAIGQAELSVTPIQAANLMAVYASGRRRLLTLIQELGHTEMWTLPIDISYWQAIRRGMYRVVNEVGGTARSTAQLPKGTGQVLCGKTGSAQAHPWPISYRVPYVDTNGREHVAIVPATTREAAVEDFKREHPDCAFDYRDITVEQRWPPNPSADGSTHSHAWFAGFLQKADENDQPIWSEPPRVAFAVMVEFGGSGGHVSAPIGRQVALTLIDLLGPQLDLDAPEAKEAG